LNELYWQQQLDYVFFFYGLAFILLAPICVNLHYMKEKSLPWIWLGLFAILHGIGEWLDMLTLSLGDTTLYSYVRTGILALSFLILFVFGCKGLFKKRRKLIWCCCPALLAVFSMGGYLTGGLEFNAVARYSLGLVGGLLSAMALFRASKAGGNVKLSLSFAALFMALYAFASGAIVPAAHFFPASIVNYASFASTTGVPIQLVRGILVILICISFWIYHKQISELTNLSQNGKNNFGYQLCITLLVIVSAGWVCTDLFGRHTESDERRDKLHQAEIAAAAIDPKCIDYVTEAPSGSNGNIRLHNQLLNILKTNSQINRLYLMPLSGEKVFESVPNGGSGVYNTAGKHVRSPKEIFKTFAAEKAIVTDPYRDENRISQSIFATIRDPGSGRTIAVLGLDFKANDLPFIIARHRLMPICITWLIAMLFISYYVLRQRAWESSKTIAINEQRLLEAQSMAHLGSWEYDLDNNKEYRSAEFNRILGLQDEKSGIIRDSVFDYIHQDDRRHVKEKIADSLKRGMSYEVDYRIIRPDGTERFVHSQGKVLAHGNGKTTKFIGTIMDITEAKEAEEKIIDLAYTDHLTGLPNRLLFLDRCEQAIAIAKRNGTQMALLFFDLDRFKDVNDTLGHHAGDLLLKAVSGRILKTIRSSSTLARLGGDEFALLCASIAYPQDAGVVANKIIELFHQPFEIEGKTIFSSASIGIVIYPDDGSDSSNLLKNADLAMYAAKERGRNAFNFFSDKMNLKVQERATIEEGLRKAMQSDQLLLHYQPQVELGSGRVFGAEALCRWLHPVLGFIAPDKFIPVAEQTGLIRHIGDWVLKTACRQCNEWHLNGFPLSIAVNVSIYQLRFSDFPERVKEALDEAGLPPEYLELEITESLLMNNAEESMVMLNRLKSIGVRIAIDDFGTGYSSLSYLNKFSLDRIKIDKSFIGEITLRDDSASIVRAIVAIGHSLGLKVIAEGIETEEEQEMLLRFSCDEAQGYHYSKPIPAFDIGRLIYSNMPLGKSIPLLGIPYTM
jgi:diguanylate cyclase (GGDEF)-like protein/PAS domain S-box-containing protein